ncbi:MAG: pyridine nucleotide-disulfide oxidoreductase [Spirochaetae bacterium HGW-Spirochaetae-5]|nr:MAG: pyridine nucleotide-disulfide oxidoreductase [Spirochaetae bacterium HGW-Spirochaetae-5]
MDFNLSTISFAAEKNFTPVDPGKVYDVLIIGGGPAGMTAAVYCMRKGVDTAIIIKNIGGQVAETSSVENYLGYKYINGVELVDKFKEQVFQFSIGYEEGQGVTAVTDGDIKSVTLDDGRVLRSRALIIASGKSWKKLGIPGEQRLTGRGVAYCTICDAPLFAGKKVVVVGGGNSGVEAAIDLASVASEVVIVQLMEELTADKILIDKLNSFNNVSMIFSSRVTEIIGEDLVKEVTVENVDTGKSSTVVTDGIFIEIGLDPNSSFASGVVEMNSASEILVDSGCATNRDGIFAAGDVTSVPFKQIIIAGGEGAKAALSACEYILKRN